MNLTILIKKDKNNFIAEVPSLKWAWAAGDSPEEAKKELKWVTESGLSTIFEKDENFSIKNTSYEEVLEIIKSYRKDHIISDIDINIDKIKSLNKTERTNITIKKKFKNYAKSKNIALSKLINDALENIVNQ